MFNIVVSNTVTSTTNKISNLLLLLHYKHKYFQQHLKMNSLRKFTQIVFRQNLFPFFPRFSSESSSSSAQGVKGLVVGVYDQDKSKDKSKEDTCIELSPEAYKVDQSTGGKVINALNGLRGDIGKLGKVTLLSNLSEEYPAIAVSGMGPKNAKFSDAEYLDEEAENVRIATGVGAKELQRVGVTEVVVEDFKRPEAAAEGSALGLWYYSDIPTQTKLSRLKEEGAGVTDESKTAEDDWMRGLTKAESQNIVRCLCETPPNFITPTQFAQRARDLLCPYGVQVFARDVRWMKENHMAALLTIGSSSIEPPVFLDLNYCSDDPKVNPYIMIGQGTTFNCGGLCRKECSRMMDADYASAATMLGVFKAVAAMRLPINLRGFIPMYEYMLGGLSLKPMDIIETHGHLIQTPHTDDFHQITLGEAILHVIKHHCPMCLITLGTLSPGTKAFVGGTSTVYARCDNMWQHINYAGAVTGDRMWRMPLYNDYADQVLESKGVDILNLGKSKSGEPSLIAAVLNQLTPACHDFTYIDITGSSAESNGYVPYLAKGLFTGAPTRGLIQLLCHLDYCRKQIESQEKQTATAS
uniref:Cytosol aminopeptidase n=1 Tax=Cuerna arida TaxID=1464854 RepID=A0A1B6FTQ1_9HEMI